MSYKVTLENSATDANSDYTILPLYLFPRCEALESHAPAPTIDNQPLSRQGSHAAVSDVPTALWSMCLRNLQSRTDVESEENDHRKATIDVKEVLLPVIIAP